MYETPPQIMFEEAIHVVGSKEKKRRGERASLQEMEIACGDQKKEKIRGKYRSEKKELREGMDGLEEQKR
jgi:hypothetical protein